MIQFGILIVLFLVLVNVVGYVISYRHQKDNPPVWSYFDASDQEGRQDDANWKKGWLVTPGQTHYCDLPEDWVKRQLIALERVRSACLSEKPVDLDRLRYIEERINRFRSPEQS
jgi:hypothetical protein